MKGCSPVTLRRTEGPTGRQAALRPGSLGQIRWGRSRCPHSSRRSRGHCRLPASGWECRGSSGRRLRCTRALDCPSTHQPAGWRRKPRSGILRTRDPRKGAGIGPGNSGFRRCRCRRRDRGFRCDPCRALRRKQCRTSLECRWRCNLAQIRSQYRMNLECCLHCNP